MSDRYAYLSCCTQEEREDEGTQEEYEQLEIDQDQKQDVSKPQTTIDNRAIVK